MWMMHLQVNHKSDYDEDEFFKTVSIFPKCYFPNSTGPDFRTEGKFLDVMCFSYTGFPQALEIMENLENH